MGTYIKTVCETFDGDVWEVNEDAVFTNDPDWPGTGKHELTDTPFYWQSYTMYSLFANVRNYQDITPIADQRGLPEDSSMSALDELLGQPEICHWADLDQEDMTVSDRFARRTDPGRCGFSWLTAQELLAVDYSKVVASSMEEGEFETLSESLGPRYFEHLEQLQSLGKPENVRILFGFS